MKNQVLLLASLSLTFGIAAGIHYSASIYFIYFQTEYGASVGQVSTVYALPSACFYLGGPLYASIYKNIGVFKTYLLGTIFIFAGYLGTSLSQSYFTLLLFHGITLGIGFGFSHLTSYTVTGTAFKRTRALANNTIYSSILTFGMLATPVAQSLINVYTWRGVFLLEAGFVLNVIPLGYIVSRLFKSVMAENAKISTNENPNIANNHTAVYTRKVSKDPLFYIFCVSSVGMYTVQTLTVSYLVRYAQSIHVEDGVAAAMLFIFLFACLCLSIVTGVLSAIDINSTRFKFFTMENYLLFLCFLQATVMMIPIFFPTQSGYFTYSILLGVSFGGIAAFPLSLLPKYFGVEQLATAMGLRSFIAGVFSLVIPPFTGFLVDLSGTYKPVQYVSATLVILGGILLIFVNQRIKIREKENEIQKPKDEHEMTMNTNQT